MPDQANDTTDQATTQTSAVRLISTSARARYLRLGVTCAALFMLALGVRLFYWQDNRQGFVFTGMAKEYKAHAQVLYECDLMRFMRGADPPSDVDFAMHPLG